VDREGAQNPFTAVRAEIAEVFSLLILGVLGDLGGKISAAC
jgi:hypothetical protein